jgi:hypothetical protein
MPYSVHVRLEEMDGWVLGIVWGDDGFIVGLLAIPCVGSRHSNSSSHPGDRSSSVLSSFADARLDGPVNYLIN